MGKKDMKNEEINPEINEEILNEKDNSSKEDFGEVEEKSPLDLLQEQLEKEKTRAEENYNRMLRLQADFDNFRRRTQMEKEDFYKYASENLLLNLLPVLDNFQRALEAKEDDPNKVIEGVEMIYRQIIDVLEKEGLTFIEAVGTEFDPLKHEAVVQEPVSEKFGDNLVSQEFRRGYLLKDKVIRPSMVAVAKA